MGELELFGPESTGAPERRDAPSDPGRTPPAPLAARMRPRTVDAFVGQRHLLGPEKPIAVMIASGTPSSMILWGPPGSGKTTLAHLIADHCDATFVPFSAVTEGIARVREIIAEARERRRATGRRTILFCDEIHRFNKAQQDAFLPHVEEGVVTLIGATTENPSFEIVRPLLSRAPVFVLEPLSADDLEALLATAIESEAGLGGKVVCTPEALALIARAADGDARRALGALEAAAKLVAGSGHVDEDTAREAIQHRHAVYDKSGEQHYDLISALHKSVRGSDPDAALYWLARMLAGGEDPLYLARRLVRMASEDIGLADPRALGIAVSARDAFHFLGAPEGELALAEATVYLATAPKSNRLYTAWSAARQAAADSPGAQVPKHLRNAPTELMRDLGYGEGYRYDPLEPGRVADQTYLPPEVEDATFYRPGEAGYEARVTERLERWSSLRRAKGGEGSQEAPPV